MKHLLSAFLIITAATLGLPPDSLAGKWRINNTGIPADFTSLQAAATSLIVGSNDTLYVESSMFSYGTVTVMKRLTLIGPGYFLGQNPETQASVAPAMIDNITFSENCNGSMMTGMTVLGSTTLQDTGIVLIRNKLNNVSVSFPSLQNYIGQNYIRSLYMYASDWNAVYNNIFALDTPLSGGYCFNMNETSSGTVRNNIFCGCQYISDCIYENNIATGTAAAGNDVLTNHNSSVSHNIGASNQYGTSNNNQANIDMATVFTGTGSDDGKYSLLPGSSAAGAGVNGEDCGIFGGGSPYVLSGLPNLPAVWHVGISGDQVTVKVKSN